MIGPNGFLDLEPSAVDANDFLYLASAFHHAEFANLSAACWTRSQQQLAHVVISFWRVGRARTRRHLCAAFCRHAGNAADYVVNRIIATGFSDVSGVAAILVMAEPKQFVGFVAGDAITAFVTSPLLKARGMRMVVEHSRNAA
jgi:hypothetical protein